MMNGDRSLNVTQGCTSATACAAASQLDNSTANGLCLRVAHICSTRGMVNRPHVISCVPVVSKRCLSVCLCH